MWIKNGNESAPLEWISRSMYSDDIKENISNPEAPEGVRVGPPNPSLNSTSVEAELGAPANCHGLVSLVGKERQVPLRRAPMDIHDPPMLRFRKSMRKHSGVAKS